VQLRVVTQQQRISVVGNGNIDVGNKTPTRKPGQPIVGRSGSADGKNAPPQMSGAMSQQRGDSGNQSAPQKLVQLVGCRDPKAKSAPWIRPRSAPKKP
jgi:hypothetical protein